MNTLRAVTAVILGFFATGFICSGELCVALVRRFYARLTGARLLHPQGDTLRPWATFLHSVCARKLLGIALHPEVRIELFSGNEIAIVIANHPTTLMSASWATGFFTWVSRRAVVICKREHLWNPLGWLLWATGSGIFVDRSNSEQSREAIREALANKMDRPVVVLIFPDMRRPKPHLILRDRHKFRDKITGIDHWLRHTLVPRAGGLHEIIVCLAGIPKRIICVTAGLDKSDTGILSGPNIIGGTYRMLFEEVNQLPIESSKLRERLNHIWKQMNLTLTDWLRSETRPT